MLNESDKLLNYVKSFKNAFVRSNSRTPAILQYISAVLVKHKTIFNIVTFLWFCGFDLTKSIPCVSNESDELLNHTKSSKFAFIS